MRKVVIGLVMGVILMCGVQAVFQARSFANDVSAFTLRKTPSVTYVPAIPERLSQPQIQVLYDNRGSLTGVAYENQYGQSLLYDSAGRYQGMIQPEPQPVFNK